MTGRQIGGVIVAGIALVPLYFAWHYSQELGRFLDRAVQTRAVVTGYSEERSSGRPRSGDFMQVPELEFTDHQGQRVTGKANVGTAGEAYPVGATVGIWYDPNFMQDIRLNSFLGLYFLPLMFLLPGLAALLFGLWRMRPVR